MQQNDSLVNGYASPAASSAGLKPSVVAISLWTGLRGARRAESAPGDSTCRRWERRRTAGCVRRPTAAAGAVRLCARHAPPTASATDRPPLPPSPPPPPPPRCRAPSASCARAASSDHFALPPALPPLTSSGVLLCTAPASPTRHWQADVCTDSVSLGAPHLVSGSAICRRLLASRHGACRYRRACRTRRIMGRSFKRAGARAGCGRGCSLFRPLA